MHEFLSEPWFEAVEALRDEAPEPPDTMKDLVLNVVVTGGAQGETEVHLANGQFQRGLAEGASTKITVPYDVAREIFVEGNFSVAMQAFMGGKIKVEGDMSKIMALQAGAASPSPEQAAFQVRLKELTA